VSVQRVLVIGGTGMLGRPVVRRLIDEGFSVRAMVRDVERARALLPARCELVRGDVRDETLLLAAVDGVDAIYVNLAEPMVKRAPVPPAWDVEADGTRAVMAAARAAGVRRVLRISAMGVYEAAIERRPWWAAVAKRDADHLLIDSDLDWTIFRPTWFMESLCTLKLGRLMPCPDLPRSPLRWISGDDYAKQVAGALRNEASVTRVYQPQGPELLTIKQAMRRLVQAWRPQRLRIVPMPVWSLRPAAMFSGRAHYLASLMVMTRDHFARVDREAVPTDLPAATMTIEGYARYVERTGDWPSK
jgi:uncharacterized protein YbjT (DUF2867 family)